MNNKWQMMSSSELGVIVYAESPIVREGLLSLIDTQLQLEVIGTASNPPSLVELLQEQQPEVILLDWSSALEGSFGDSILVANSPAVVILVDEENSDWLVEKLRSGVCSLLPIAEEG